MDILSFTGIVLMLTFADSLAVSIVKRHPHHSHCTDITAFNRLHDLIGTDECLGVDKVFQSLADITSSNYTCRVAVVNMLAEKFPRGTRMPSHCHCTGPNELHNYDTNHYNHFRDCHSNASYMSIYDSFYRRNGNNATACRTHHSIWYELSLAPVHGGCQFDLVEHLAATFKAHPDPCTCSKQDVVHAHPTPVTSAHAHTTPVTIPDHCNTIPNVALLNNLMTIQSKPCLSIHTLWHKLEDIQRTAPDCLGIIDKLAHTFPVNKPHYCLCEGHVETSHNPFLSDQHHDELAKCMRVKPYKILEKFLFEDTIGNACVDHKFVWTSLSQLKSADGSNCMKDFIETAARKYTTLQSDQCKCHKTDFAVTFTTPSHTIMSTKATVPMTTTKKTTTTTKVATTTPHSIHTYSCKKFQTVEAIANHIVVNSTNATHCVGPGSNEGYVLTECNVTSIDQWHKGRKVWPGCNDIPWYTPVAVFRESASTYNPRIGLSGIFAGCLTNGFRLLVEHCTGFPTIVHIDNGGHRFGDPSNYYLID